MAGHKYSHEIPCESVSEWHKVKQDTTTKLDTF
jgi:hypothetical protein